MYSKPLQEPDLWTIGIGRTALPASPATKGCNYRNACFPWVLSQRTRGFFFFSDLLHPGPNSQSMDLLPRLTSFLSFRSCWYPLPAMHMKNIYTEKDVSNLHHSCTSALTIGSSIMAFLSAFFQTFHASVVHIGILHHRSHLRDFLLVVPGAYNITEVIYEFRCRRIFQYRFIFEQFL